MSNLYIYEPNTNGKVVFETSHGDIEIELWPKEAPKACRNFVALIMEGYYDGLIFHRIVKDFIVQTGDPTGTGMGGESFYGEPFEDEPHQRLKFTRRGLVAMANANKRNTNTSQFMITLGMLFSPSDANNDAKNKADELNGKHTIFGKISSDGNTIYNVLKMGSLETDENEKPLYPPKIKRVRILDNPFDDIVPRTTAAEKRQQEIARRQSAKERMERESRKGVKKNTKLISFGDEADEEEAESSKGKQALSLARSDLKAPPPSSSIPSFGSIPQPPLAAPSRAPPPASRDEHEDPARSEKKEKKKRHEDEEAGPSQSAEDARQAEILSMEASIRRLNKRRQGSDDEDDVSSKKSKGPSALETILGGYTKGGRVKGRKRDEDDLLASLSSFRTKISKAAPQTAAEGSNGDGDALSDGEIAGVEVDDDLDSWMGHQLVSNTKEEDRNESRRAETDYDVIDTRLIKSKGGGGKESYDRRKPKGGYESRNHGSSQRPRDRSSREW